jgi:hypothetical protein
MLIQKPRRKSPTPMREQAGASIGEMPDAGAHADTILVTADNADLLRHMGPSPVQRIQDRLEHEFAAQEQNGEVPMKDLRPLGFAFAIIFSLIAWTLIVQLARWVF